MKEDRQVRKVAREGRMEEGTGESINNFHVIECSLHPKPMLDS